MLINRKPTKHNSIRISKFLYLIAIICLSIIVSQCGDNDSNEVNTGNENANTLDKGVVAKELEMPRVQKGNNYLLLTKYDDKNEVNYTIEWDCIKKAQRWTCWKWTKANSVKGWDRNKWRNGETFLGYGGNGDPFQPDMDIPAEYRSNLADYSGSGYNRGHICASEDRIYSKTANGQTFFLSNMHPQIYDFNGAVWANMENKVRTWRDNTVSAGGTMYICKGGTIDKVTLNGKKQEGVLARISGKSVYDINSTSGIPVPKYFFMAVLKVTAKGTATGMAFWAEHKADNSTNLAPYMISIDELERRTGYDFFCNLPDKLEDAVEALTPDASEWK